MDKMYIAFDEDKLKVVKEDNDYGVYYEVIFTGEHEFELYNINELIDEDDRAEKILSSKVRLTCDQTYTHFNESYEFDLGSGSRELLEVEDILQYIHNIIITQIENRKC